MTYKMRKNCVVFGLLGSMILPAHATEFHDVSEEDWHYTFITEVASQGYVNGVDSNAFAPENTLTVAEFSTMISNAFYGETLAALKLNQNEYWWEPYVGACALRGGLAGTTLELYGDGESTTWSEVVDQPISRFEMSQMIHSLMSERGVEFVGRTEMFDILREFSDLIPNDYLEAVGNAVAFGFLSGRDSGNFDGDTYLTRGEAATVLSNLLNSDLFSSELYSEYQLELPNSEDTFEENTEKEELETSEQEDSEALEDSFAKEELPLPNYNPNEEEYSEEMYPEEENYLEEATPDIEITPEVDKVPEVDKIPEVDTSHLPSQEDLGTWVPHTIVGSTTSSAYVHNNGIFVVDSSNYSITSEDLNARSDLQLELNQEAPQILIYHSHGTESFTQTPSAMYESTSYYRTTDNENNVIKVGEAMAKVFEEAGFVVIHDTNWHDYPSYSASYPNSKITVADYLEAYPSIQFAIDVHRDGLETNGVPYQLQSQQGDETIAQVMLFVSSETSGYEHPYWRENFALALTLQEDLLEYGDFARPIALKKGHYNQQQDTGILLLEVGNHGNTLEQAIAAGELFAYSAAQTLGGVFEEEEKGENFPIFGVNDQDIDWENVPSFG